MQITGSNVIAAPTPTVWTALNDPEVLRRCLPGCELVERSGEDAFKIVMTAAVGPLKARFNGMLRITDVKPPTDCVLQFEGSGGAMGFGKGTSTVNLREVPGGTELSYEARAQVGGKIAQVGSRVIDSVAKKMSDDFFRLFKEQFVPAQAWARTAAGTDAGITSSTVSANDVASVVVAAPTAGACVNEPDVVASTAAATSPVMVPGWWLVPAAVVGAAAAAIGALAASRILG